ncbi:hypothetical protein IAD21_01901 [Abditibacteriota bacterium]|nr:hypothetical protein IAD21_01901 [Abditibacteriota bacterium]
MFVDLVGVGEESKEVKPRAVGTGDTDVLEAGEAVEVASATSEKKKQPPLNARSFKELTSLKLELAAIQRETDIIGSRIDEEIVRLKKKIST